MTAPVTQAAEWLRAISTWLLETDNDMKLPSGILDVDPLDMADALDATEAAAKAREDALVEKVAMYRGALIDLTAEVYAGEGSEAFLRAWEIFADEGQPLAAHREGGDA